MTWSQRVAVTTRLIEGPEHEPRTASTLQPGKPVHPPNELSSFFLLLFFIFFLFPFSSFPFGWYIVSPTAPSDPPTTPTTPLPTYLPTRPNLATTAKIRTSTTSSKSSFLSIFNFFGPKPRTPTALRALPLDRRPTARGYTVIKITPKTGAIFPRMPREGGQTGRRDGQAGSIIH